MKKESSLHDLRNSPWDNFLRAISEKSGLTPAEKGHFYMRFCEANKEIFDNNTIEASVKKIDNRISETSAVNSYKKSFIEVYKKVGEEYLNIKFKSSRKDPVLFDKLKEEFKKYLQDQKSSQQISSQRMSLEQQMAKALQELNYRDQEEAFNQFLDSAITEVFWITVSYDEKNLLQHWVVKRLSRFLLGGEVPKFIPIKVSSEWRRCDIEELLWREVNNALRDVPPEDFNLKSTDSEIDKLRNLCTSKTVLIAL